LLAWDGREACRRSLYNGTAALSLCRQLRAAAAVVAAASAFAVAGCAFQLASLAAKDDADSQPTGAIAQSSGRAAADGSGPAEVDLAYARAAAADVLARGAKDSSVPWQNPQTGAGGNITPLATAYREGGLPCRDFLASYVHGAAQDWLQGAACRSASGTWEVTRLKPLKPS